MNSNPILQNKLYGMDNFFTQFVKLFSNNKLPNKIILSGKKGIGKSTLAYHFLNYVFSINEKNSYNLETKEINLENKSYKLIKGKTHSNFHLVDLKNDKNEIEISQIRKMIEFTNKSSFNNLPKFILIDNIENLNINSLNALLKIVEEPNLNVFFILIYNINKKISSTLKSRCIEFKINLSFAESIDITNKLLNKNLSDIINNDLITYYNTPGDYINLIKFSKEYDVDLQNITLNNFLLLIMNKNYYRLNNFIKLNIFCYIELFFLRIFSNLKNKNKMMSIYTKFINKIYY